MFIITAMLPIQILILFISWPKKQHDVVITYIKSLTEYIVMNSVHKHNKCKFTSIFIFRVQMRQLVLNYSKIKDCSKTTFLA